MQNTEILCLKLCRQYLNSSGFVGDFISTSYKTRDEEIILDVSSEKHDVVFYLKVKEKGYGETDGLFCLETETSVIYIEDVDIKGYRRKDSVLNKNQLFSIFRTLALQHSASIRENNGKTTIERGNFFEPFKYQDLLEDLYECSSSLENNTIDINILKEGINRLVKSSKEVFQSNTEDFCIKASVFQKKIFFNGTSEYCELLNLHKGRPTSVVYDMLAMIYLVTDQRQRQYCFHEITDYYYQVLKDNLNESNIDLEEILPSEVYKMEIKASLPYVKLELVCFYMKKLIDLKNDIVVAFNSNEYYKKLISETVFELYEHILTPKIAREDCFRILNDAIGTNYDNLRYQLTELDSLLGLLGEYGKLEITVTRENRDKVLHLFAKAVPGKMKQIQIVFAREIFLFSAFVSELIKVGLGGIANFLPKCHFVRQDVIILEDLSYLNYRPLDVEESFTYEMLELVVKQLAKMHACSFLYEEITTRESGNQFRINTKFGKYVEELNYVRGNPFVEKINNCGINSTVNFIFDQFPDVPKDIPMEIFRERSRRLFDMIYDKIKTSEKYRNVICHGDIWGGNILFKFDGNEPIECRLIDYQLIRYCPPCHDLLTFLYINADKATRTKYTSKLLEIYYEELSGIFQRYDFDLNEIYSYGHFMECCEYMKSQAVCLAALFYPNSLDRKKVQDLLVGPEKKMHFFAVDKSNVLQELMKDERVRARFKEIVEDLYELCLNMV